MDIKLIQDLADKKKWKEIVDTIEGLPMIDITLDLRNQLARAYNNISNYDEALKVLFSIKEEGESNDYWNYVAGYSYFHKGNYDTALKYFKNSFDLGRTEAQKYIDGCEKYIELKIIVKKGHKESQYELGRIYYYGQDFEKAVHWFTKSAEQGFAIAQINLGICYYNGTGIAKDFEKAVYWYKKAAEQDFNTALYKLGEFYWRTHNKDFERDSDESIKWYMKAAEKGHKESQYELGRIYYYGQDVEKDFEKGIYWYEKAAKQGHKFAQIAIGEAYCYPDFFEEDFEKAEYWFKQALNKEELSNKFVDVGKELSERLYWFYDKKGNLDYQALKPEKSIYWFEKAVELGNSHAPFHLGYSYHKYRAIQDKAKAIFWYELALKKNNNSINTLIYLADLYLERSKNVKTEINKALKLYHQALDLINKEIASYDNDNQPWGLSNDDCDHLNWLEECKLKIQQTINQFEDKTKNYLLFFDTETTGVPRNWKAPISDSQNWPRLVQIAWQLYDEHGNLIVSKSAIVKPDNFVIPKEASNVHGITTEKAYVDGEDLTMILGEFENKLKEANLLIAHNMSFDEKIIGAEFYRLSNNNPLPKIKKLCTMEKATNICKIDGPYGYKWPKLQELHYFLFNENFENAHNAEADIQATANCYFELKRRKLI